MLYGDAEWHFPYRTRSETSAILLLWGQARSLEAVQACRYRVSAARRLRL